MRYLDQFTAKSRVASEVAIRESQLTNRIATVIISLAIVTLFSIYRISPHLEVMKATYTLRTGLSVNWISPEKPKVSHKSFTSTFTPSEAIKIDSFISSYPTSSMQQDWFIFTDGSLTWDPDQLFNCLSSPSSPSIAFFAPHTIIASRAALASCGDSTFFACILSAERLPCAILSPGDAETEIAGLSFIYYPELPPGRPVAFAEPRLPAVLRCPRLPPTPAPMRAPRPVSVSVGLTGETDFVVIIEPDTFLSLPNLEKALSRFDPDKVVYAGHPMMAPTRAGDRKCDAFLSPGAGIVLSRAAAKLARECKNDLMDCFREQGIAPQSGLEMLMNPISYDEVSSGKVPIWLREYSLGYMHVKEAMRDMISFHFMSDKMSMELKEDSPHF